MSKEKQIDIVSKYHQKENLANTLYLKQDEFDLSNPFEVANCVINLGYRKINENEVVISKEEYERLKRVETEKDRLYEIKLDLEHQLIQSGLTEYIGADEIEKQASKETAEKIYRNLIELSENPCNDREEIYKAVFEPYGVEIGEIE